MAGLRLPIWIQILLLPTSRASFPEPEPGLPEPGLLAGAEGDVRKCPGMLEVPDGCLASKISA